MAEIFKDLDQTERDLLSEFLTNTSPNNQGEYRGFCAIHETPGTSKTPSASYNFDKGVWSCLSGGHGGTIQNLLKDIRAGRREEPNPNKDNVISMRTGRPSKPLPSSEEIESWNDALLGDEKAISYLASRGITKESIERWNIGFNPQEKRYMIPVLDADGKLINVRRYSRTSSRKMLPWSEGIPTSLFNPIEIKRNDAIIFCEGEWDCILLNQLGFPAVTTTAGAEGFNVSWAQAFAGKKVFLCLDDDEAGERGTAKNLSILSGIADSIYKINFNFDDKEQKDVTDFFAHSSGTIDEQAIAFKQLMIDALITPLWTAESLKDPAPSSGELITLEDSQAANSGKISELYVRVFGKQTPAFIVPKEFIANCTMDKGDVCKSCVMKKYNGKTEQSIREDDPIFIKFIDSTSLQVKELLRERVGARCKDRVQFDIINDTNIEQLVVGQSIEHAGENNDTPYSDIIYNIGSHKTPINTVARLVGSRRPDPRTQRGLFHSWLLQPQEEDIDTVQLDDEDLEDLAAFQISKNQTPLEKCYEIAEEMSRSVTNIYGRKKLHVAYDLVWHSVLGFEFMGKPIQKGWLDAMVIGDTRTGKSEAAARLRDHYRLGNMTSCEGATLAGLLGGAQQIGGKHWMVTWGIIPRNDRRLVILDEFSGMKEKGVIEELSSVRSEGVARITKIATEETSARTRLIWISNPGDGKTLSESRGIYAVKKLIPNPEDIARFDFVVGASNRDVPSSLINRVETDNYQTEYTSDICHKLLLWAWSRRSDQVRIRKSAIEAIVESSEDLGERYISDPPLIQIENIRMKLARIAVAIAARTFSTDINGELIIVRREHVQSAVQFLDDIYSEDAMGYGKQSERIASRRSTAGAHKQEVKEMLKRNPQLMTVMMALKNEGRFKVRDINELGGQSPELGDGPMIVHWLTSRDMLQWLSGGFLGMEPAFTDLLTEMEG